MSKTAETVLAAARANNEPVFVLRARDKFASAALYEYMRRCMYDGASPEHNAGVFNIIEDFISFEHQNPEQMKIPD